MRIVDRIADVRGEIAAAKSLRKSVGLVPTMGALHGGHMALVSRARAECDVVAVSIFVNPTQFGPHEDYDRYPRTFDRDCRMCSEKGVDLVFVPSVDEMYRKGFDCAVEVRGVIAESLEGECRPGHFRGVATVVLKLFNITAPDYAYFGLKDYQQLSVVRKMVEDLNVPVRVVPVETVREPDGLAMSSRNAYLNETERKAARVLSFALDAAVSMFSAGERNAQAIESEVKRVLESEPLAAVDYAVVRDAETLETIRKLERAAVVLLAVRIGKTRLIDNAVLQP